MLRDGEGFEYSLRLMRCPQCNGSFRIITFSI